MNLVPIIDRLKDRVSGARYIGGAADLAAALRGVVITPSVYVMPLGDRPVKAGDDEHCAAGAGDVVTFGVLLALADARDAAGGEVLEELPEFRRQVRRALVAWAPDERRDDPVRFVRGELVKFEGDGYLWWADAFSYVCMSTA